VVHASEAGGSAASADWLLSQHFNAESLAFVEPEDCLFFSSLSLVPALRIDVGFSPYKCKIEKLIIHYQQVNANKKFWYFEKKCHQNSTNRLACKYHKQRVVTKNSNEIKSLGSSNTEKVAAIW